MLKGNLKILYILLYIITGQSIKYFKIFHLRIVTLIEILKLKYLKIKFILKNKVELEKKEQITFYTICKILFKLFIFKAMNFIFELKRPKAFKYYSDIIHFFIIKFIVICCISLYINNLYKYYSKHKLTVLKVYTDGDFYNAIGGIKLKMLYQPVYMLENVQLQPDYFLDNTYWLLVYIYIFTVIVFCQISLLLLFKSIRKIPYIFVYIIISNLFILNELLNRLEAIFFLIYYLLGDKYMYITKGLLLENQYNNVVQNHLMDFYITNNFIFTICYNYINDIFCSIIPLIFKLNFGFIFPILSLYIDEFQTFIYQLDFFNQIWFEIYNNNYFKYIYIISWNTLIYDIIFNIKLYLLNNIPGLNDISWLQSILFTEYTERLSKTEIDIILMGVDTEIKSSVDFSLSKEVKNK